MRKSNVGDDGERERERDAVLKILWYEHGVDYLWDRRRERRVNVLRPEAGNGHRTVFYCGIQVVTIIIVMMQVSLRITVRRASEEDDI